MVDKKKSYDALLRKLEELDPLLVAAIYEVDETLIDEFRKLSIDEKISRASEGAAFLSGFQKQ